MGSRQIGQSGISSRDFKRGFSSSETELSSSILPTTWSEARKGLQGLLDMMAGVVVVVVVVCCCHGFYSC